MHLGNGISVFIGNIIANYRLIDRDHCIRETILMTVGSHLQNQQFCFILKNGSFVYY